MRFSRVCVIAAVLLLSACRARDRVHVETDEGPPRQLSMISMSDPKAVPQLLSGFYGLEGNSWRWTAAHFSVQLEPPPGADVNGAVLKVEMTIPKPLLDSVKNTALTAKIGNTALSPESFTQPGNFTYLRDVPTSTFNGDPVKVDFALDRFLSPGKLDDRELGLIVTSIGFEPRNAPRTAP